MCIDNNSSVNDRLTIMMYYENWDDEFAKTTNPIIIDNPNPLRRVPNSADMERTQNGIFSPKFGVDIKENEDSSNVYRCDMGCTRSIAHEGMICEECGTEVRVSDGLISTRGWILLDGPYKILTPNAWKICKEFFGKHFLKIIDLDMGTSVNADGVFTIPAVTADNKFYGIGYWGLQNNFEKVVDYYYNLLYKKSNSYLGRIHRNMLKIFFRKGMLYASHVSVITPLLREALIISSNKEPKIKKDKKTGVYSRDEVKPTIKVEALNGIYAEIVANAHEYNKVVHTSQAFAYAVFLAMQNALIEIPNYIFKDGVLSGKEGYMNAAIHGGTMNFSGRAVITPMTTPSDADEIELPWRLFLTICKYELIRCIGIISQSDILESERLWTNAFELGSNQLIEDAIAMFRSESIDNNFYVLINRPPTLLVESILFMKVRYIHRDLNQKCMSVSHMILGKIDGDHDGDALIIHAPKTRNEIEVFKKLSPKNMVIDKITGLFDASVAPTGALGALLGQYNDPDSISHLE